MTTPWGERRRQLERVRADRRRLEARLELLELLTIALWPDYRRLVLAEALLAAARSWWLKHQRGRAGKVLELEDQQP